MLERDVKTYFYKRCKTKGLEVRKTMYQYRSHCPDAYVFGIGWVELKANKGRLRKMQEVEIATMRSHGEKVWVISSKEDVDQFIEEVT